MFTADSILQNRYRIIGPLGRGGMGAVYEAFDERLTRVVALKETLVAETDELRRAFEREARLLANLSHPALPKVLDHFSEGEGMFLVMEFIPGDDLGVMLEKGGRAFSPSEVMRYADQLLDALEYLHGLNPPVLHRDIKPSNLKLISQRHIVLLDFGLAKGSAGRMTQGQNRSVHGYSPNYSSLEQIQGTGTDERSDLYSLGATFYHLLTGVKPPDALSRATAIVNGQKDPLQPPDRIRREAPASVSAALMRAMALSIDHRPRTAREMREELHRMAPRAGATVPIVEEDERTKVILPSAPADTAGPKAHPERARQVVIPIPEETVVTGRQAKSSWIWIVSILLIAGAATLFAILYLWMSGKDTGERTKGPKPVAGSSPTLTPSPAENTNREPEAGPEELAARRRLSERNIPFTEPAFIRAVEKGDTDLVELFLKAGMNPDVRDGAGRTALINAASKGSNNISRKLLSKGADVNSKDNTGTTALMEAAGGDHRETTKVLLEGKVDINLADNRGQTALIRAAARGRTEIVRMLINRGARVDIRDGSGRDALTWAEINDHSDVVDMLRKAGATSQ